MKFTGFLSAILNRSVDWSTIRKTGGDLDEVRRRIVDVGEKALLGLRSDKFNFKKVGSVDCLSLSFVPAIEQNFQL